MTIRSAQTDFKGQSGWNDLDMDTLNLAAAKKGRRPRRIITPHDTTNATSVMPKQPSEAPPKRVPSRISITGPPPMTATPPVSKPPRSSESEVDPK